MQVRVFESADMSSGLKLVRKELGPDALILSSRTVHNGKLGLLGKPTFEITAAIDSPWPKDTKKKVGKKTQVYQEMSSQQLPSRNTAPRINCTVGGDDLAPGYDTRLTTNRTSASTGDQEARHMSTSPVSPVQADTVNRSDAALRSEVDELKGLVKNLAGEISRLTPQQVTNQQSSQASTSPVAIGDLLQNRLGSLRTTTDPVIALLARHGISGETARTIAGFVKENLTEGDLAYGERIRSFIVQTIQNLIDVQPPQFQDNSENSEQSVIALVGPTGVGKTTTLAKLAAHYLANFSNSIALITIDTYRIAAVEQLKVYGDIMHLPVEVVISPEQLQEAIQRHQDKALILIDTAGRSPRDTLCIEELSAFLRPDLNIEKHLVLSAATRENELLDTITRFQPLGLDRTIFTKVDECTHNGVILNVQIQNSSPLSYITNGQRVPEDLLEITKLSAAELIMSLHEGITHD